MALTEEQFQQFADLQRHADALAWENAGLRRRTAELEAKLAAARELIDELRGYCASWDYKYGRGWDERRKALET